jgi:quinol monooxygenase YgiN
MYFRHTDETKTKLILTELYADEQVFLKHGRDAEFGKLYNKLSILQQVKAEKNYVFEVISIVPYQK